MSPAKKSNACLWPASEIGEVRVFPGQRRIEPGAEYLLEDVRDADNSIRLTYADVEQRHWSRVALGLVSAASPERGPKVFIKQHIDRAGAWQPKSWSYEFTATKLAEKILEDRIYVPPLGLTDGGMLINAYDFADMISLGILLRREPNSFAELFPFVLAEMGEVLATLDRGLPEEFPVSDVPAKHRPYGSEARAICFKGLDIRNVGLLLNRDGAGQEPSLAMFDFGRVYLAPIEEAAAKLLISIGLLNWGKPLRRFIKGPNFDLLAASLDVLRPYLDGDALRAELRLHESFKFREIKGDGRTERALKRIGVNMLGRSYLRQLNRWCARHVG